MDMNELDVPVEYILASQELDRTREVIGALSNYFQSELETDMAPEDAEAVHKALGIITKTRGAQMKENQHIVQQFYAKREART